MSKALSITVAICKFPNFNEIAKSDGSTTKWVASEPFSLEGIPKSQFCLMYRPRDNSYSSGLYLEPINLGGYKTMKVRMTICVERFLSGEISKTTITDFHYQELHGQGWPNYFQSAETLNSSVVSNTLTAKCRIEVLEGVVADTSELDRYTSFDWKLHPFSAATEVYGLLKFEFKSAAFTIDKQRDLSLRLVLKKHPQSPFVQIHLVPVETKPFKVRLNYLIWIEDRRNGVRLPTWNKQANFDFNDLTGQFDSQFVHVEQLRSSKSSFSRSPFVTVDDTLNIYCRIYHDTSMIQQIPSIEAKTETKMETKGDLLGNKQIKYDSSKHPFPYYSDFKLAAVLEKYERTAPQNLKAPRFSVQELANALAEVRKIREKKELLKRISDTKIWDIREEDKILQMKYSRSKMPSWLRTSNPNEENTLLAVDYLNSPENNLPGTSCELKPFYTVEKVPRNELFSSCEILCRANVFEIQTVDLFGKSPVVDRIVSKVNFGPGQTLKIHLNKFCLSTVKKLVEYFVYGEVELKYFDAYDMVSLANEFGMEKLKDICSNKLVTCLNAHRACCLLTFAIQNDMTSLADKAISTAADHFSEIHDIWGWNDLCPNDKELSLELKAYINELSFKRANKSH